MNILYLVPNPPSLVRVRPYNLIRHLKSLGHQVTVATIWRHQEEYRDIENLRDEGFDVIEAPLSRGRILVNSLEALAQGLPFQAAFSNSPALLETLESRWRHNGQRPPFDLLHVEHLRGARYGIRLRAAQPARQRLPVVWDSVDCISYLFEQTSTHSRSRLGRTMAWLDLARTRRFEGWLAHQFDEILVTSEKDKDALTGLAQVANRHQQLQQQPSPIHILPNGVDLDYFTPTSEPRQQATVLFSGKMSYHANVTTALYLISEVMPSVWERRPEVKLVIAGKDPTPELCKLQESIPNLTVTGTVADLRPYLRSATVAVSPLVYGAGIQNKVLEAMACGAPVIASPQAASALQIVDGEHLLLAQDTLDFSRQILRLLDDEALQNKLRLTGRRYVEQEHDWGVIAQRLESIYQKHVDRNSTPVVTSPRMLTPL